MFIKQIKEFDCNSGEADLIVSDGIYELICYYHPAENFMLGTPIREVSTLFSEDIKRVDKNEYLISKGSDYYSYYLHGKVIDKQAPKIGIGKITINLDKPLAKDIEEGEFVELKVSRLDCYI